MHDDGLHVIQARSLTLPEALCISEAGRLYRELMSLLSGRQPITLNGSQVETADTAGMQVLTAFHREANRIGISIRWQEPSASLTRAAVTLGLSEELHLEN